MKEALVLYFDQTYNSLMALNVFLTIYLAFSAAISDNFEYFFKSRKKLIIFILCLIAFLILLPSKEVINLLPI